MCNGNLRYSATCTCPVEKQPAEYIRKQKSGAKLREALSLFRPMGPIKNVCKNLITKKIPRGFARQRSMREK
jgi:hypothetical protein